MTRRGYKHWFSEIGLPEPIEEGDCLTLYPLMRAGNQHAQHRVIRGHLRYGMALVGRYVALAPNKTDDLVSVMCEALVDGVKMISDGSIDDHATPNITGYLVTTIKGRLKKFIAKDGVFRVSLKTFQKIKQKGSDLPEVEGNLDAFADVLVEYQHSDDTTQIMEVIATNVQQRRVLELRLEGRNDREIAPLMGLSYKRISQIRQKIGQTYLENFNE